MKPLFEANKNRAGGTEYPFYVSNVRTAPADEGYDMQHHWHYHMELLYTASGTVHIASGVQATQVVPQGSLVLFYPREVHAVHVPAGEASEHIVISFDPEFLAPMPRLAFELKHLLPYLESLQPSFKVFQPAPGEQTELAEIAGALLTEYRDKPVGFELAAAAHIYTLLIRLLRTSATADLLLPRLTATAHPELRLFQELLTYMDAHMHEPLTASAMAARCRMSYSHFAKRFKAVMKSSFTQYLNFVRIQKAGLLLLEPDRSITQIALDTGYSDSSYFIRQFKRIKGCSPHQYRLRLRSPAI